MSKLFFDHLVELVEVDKEIRKVAKTSEEREEIQGLVDEIIHRKVLDSVLGKLPRDCHEEFLGLYHKCPHDEEVIFGYLKGKTGKEINDLEKTLKAEIEDLGIELLAEINPHTNIEGKKQTVHKG